MYPARSTLPLWLFVVAAQLPILLCQNLFGIPVAGPSRQATKKKMIVHRVGQCPGQKDLPIFVPDMRVSVYNATNNVVTGMIIFREDFPNGWDISATVKKCDDFQPASTCRPYLNNIANSNQCMLLRLTDMMWMKYLKGIRPKAECPFRKGNYTYGETIVDEELVKYMPGTGSTYWQVELTGKVKDRQVLCIIVQLNTRPKKN